MTMAGTHSSKNKTMIFPVETMAREFDGKLGPDAAGGPGDDGGG